MTKMEDYKKILEEGKFKVGADVPEITFISIGKRGVRRLDGYEKASGEAIYNRDIQIPGMLYARVLPSPYAHARIRKMDTSKAEAYPGVRAILRYDDPELKGRELNGSYFAPEWVDKGLAGWALKPIHLVLGDEAFYEGHPMGVAVAADSEQIAIEALQLVDIEWEELPFVLDQEEALKPDAPILRPNAKSNVLVTGGDLVEPAHEVGSVQNGFQEADKIIEFRSRRRAHLWAGAELPCVVVRWRDDNLEMWIHEQQPYHSKMLISEWLNLPMNRITVHSPYMGCSFGGRGNPANVSQNGMNILAALFSRRTKRPVKFLYDRSDTFFGESGDMMISDFKVGAKKDGTITAVSMKNNFAVYMCTNGLEHFIDNSRIPNLRLETVIVDVSIAPAWWHRCEQLPNVFCFTLVLEKVAAELGLDPTEVALKNDGYDGKDSSALLEYKKKHGFPDRDSLKECIEAGKKAIGWEENWHAPGTRRLPNGKMHGLGFTWTHQWDDVRGTGSACVLIENDGTVSIIGHQADIGVNPWTAYCQIVADEIGVPFEDVRLKPFDLDHGFALMSPDGSCCLCSNGNLVRKAARKAKNMLLELAATKFGEVKPEDLEIKGREINVKQDPKRKMPIRDIVKNAMPIKKPIRDIVKNAMPMFDSCVFWTEAPIIAWVWHNQGIWGNSITTNRPRLCRQAQFVEVEVDTETGLIEVSKLINVNDVGKAISPETVEGQMYGGSYMGVGRALTEEMIWDPKTGVLLNRGLLDYKYSTMRDSGPIDAIYLETGLGHGPYGACGVGESTPTIVPAMFAPAVYNAIGKWIDDFPITPDKVLAALGKA